MRRGAQHVRAPVRGGEPKVTDDDDDALNVRASYELARSKPRSFEQLTGETPNSFDELYKIVQLPLEARNYRGDLRQRAASQAPRVSDELQLYLHHASLPPSVSDLLASDCRSPWP
jgi:hypothetical protein